MTRGNTTKITDELYAYTLAHNPPLDDVQRELVETTYAELPGHAGMQSAQEQGPLLAFLVRLTGPGTSWRSAPSRASPPCRWPRRYPRTGC